MRPQEPATQHRQYRVAAAAFDTVAVTVLCCERMPKADHRNAILKQLSGLATLANVIERRITRLEEKLTLMDGNLAGLDLNVSRKLVELAQTLAVHSDLLEAIGTEVKGLRQERAAQLVFNRRSDQRVEALAKKVSLDLGKVGAAA